MKKALAMKWVKALRSRKYEQGVGALRVGDSYCCLGVLAKVCNFEDSQIRGAVNLMGLKGGGPEDCGLNSPLGDLNIKRGGKKYLCLAEANDSGLTFKEIAKIIEKRYREL